jgi:LPXTG-motif cell wall-anchored protein
MASTVLLCSAIDAPSAAAAPPPPLQVSTDGSVFVRSLTVPLFDPTFRIVPQGSLSRDLWVRNTGTSAGRLRVDLLNATSSDPDLAGALTISASEVAGSGTPNPTTVAAAGGCTVVLSAVPVAAGQTVKVTVAAALGDLDGRRGQDATASFGFRVVLVDAQAPAPADPTACTAGDDEVDVPGTGDPDPTTSPTGTPSPTDTPSSGGPSTHPGDPHSHGPSSSGDPSDGPGGSLAHTGADNAVQALGVALVALLGGGLLVLLTRRRRRKDDES